MPTLPIIFKTTAGIKQHPEALNQLLEQEIIQGLKAVWSKEGLVVNDPDFCMLGMIRHLLDYARRETAASAPPAARGHAKCIKSCLWWSPEAPTSRTC